MCLLNRIGLYTRKDFTVLEGVLLRHSIHVARIADHAFATGYVPPSEIAPYQNKRYHLDRLKATLKMRAPSLVRMVGL